MPSAIRRARASVSGGVGRTSSIFQSGWKALKWIGTSGPDGLYLSDKAVDWIEKIANDETD